MTTQLSRRLAVSERANAAVESASLAIAYVRTWTELVEDGAGKAEVAYKLTDARNVLRGALAQVDALIAEIGAEAVA